MIKNLLKNYFSNLAYFYRFLEYRIFIFFIVSVSVGILDGFGIAMFLPLLQMMGGNNSMSNIQGMGNLDFIIKGIQSMGLQITLNSVLSIMVIFFLFKGVAKYFSGYYRVKVQQYFVKRLRFNMLNAFNKMSFKKFMIADVGRIQNTMSGEVEKVSRTFLMYFGTFEQVVLVIVYVGFAFVVDIKFAALITVGSLFTNIIYSRIYKLTKRSSAKLTSEDNLYQGQIIQHVGNFKYLKATSLITTFSEKLKQTIINIEYNRKKIGVYGAFLLAAREPMMVSIVAIVILVQVQVLNGDLEPILISLIFFYRALAALSLMQTNWNKFLENSGSLSNVQTFQVLLNNSVERNGSVQLSGFSNLITLKNVTFKYDENVILNDVSISIQKNESIAFVGESGSGKTTLVNILAGLFHVDEGKMLIDGIDREDLDIASFQRRIGYVTQEPVIFSDTIFNNITFWAPQTDDNLERFNNVISKASLQQFINALPDKENTLLGNNGVNISGGQKQRISIARELFKQIDILILDEATSALDTETERSIQESIDELKGEYTILMVAHRLSTVRNVDRVALMSKGRIVAIDKFDNLRSNNQIFKGMIELQEFN
jgi:subfamily B ATP-binding cassette protein MsbA